MKIGTCGGMVNLHHDLIHVETMCGQAALAGEAAGVSAAAVVRQLRAVVPVSLFRGNKGAVGDSDIFHPLYQKKPTLGNAPTSC